MQEKHLFEYATIRLVPKVEREEFLNIGVVLYCSSLKYLACRFELNEKRLQAFNCDLDEAELNQHLTAFQRICEGAENAGPIGQLPLASRFRWLTAIRSTILQTCRVHPGFCINPEQTLSHLFQHLVQ